MGAVTAVAEVTPSPVSVSYEPVGALARLGIIALSTDLTSEADAARLVPPELAAVHVTRVPFHNPTTPQNVARIAPELTGAAALILPGLRLAAIAFSCTAASVEIGDDAVKRAIGAARPGVPVVTPPDAALAGFAALGLQRMALVTPYLVETTRPMAAYFARRGLDVVSAQCLGIADDRDIARVHHETIVEAAVAADRPEVEGIFLSCTALPALGAIEAIEERLGKPAICSNQAFLWQLLHHAGVAPRAGAPGRLFAVAPGGSA